MLISVVPPTVAVLDVVLDVDDAPNGVVDVVDPLATLVCVPYLINDKLDENLDVPGTTQLTPRATSTTADRYAASATHRRKKPWDTFEGGESPPLMISGSVSIACILYFSLYYR